MTTPYYDNIEEATLNNEDYRRVLYTGKMQLVLMTLQPGEEIGEEIHEDHDQFFRVEQGEATVYIDDKKYILKEDHVIIVPAGSKHNVINAGNKPLKLYTIYAPPEHPHGVVHHTKEDQLKDPRYKDH